MHVHVLLLGTNNGVVSFQSIDGSTVIFIGQNRAKRRRQGLAGSTPQTKLLLWIIGLLLIYAIHYAAKNDFLYVVQKYRSHRKHLMAREAEAASWAQKRQMYYAAAVPTKDMPAPTVGFPPPPFGRPLHVWGHPPTAAPLLPVWPRHLAPPPRPWAPVDDPAAAYWQQQYNVLASSLSLFLQTVLYSVVACDSSLAFFFSPFGVIYLRENEIN
jgi:hypothetical protein